MSRIVPRRRLVLAFIFLPITCLSLHGCRTQPTKEHGAQPSTGPVGAASTVKEPQGTEPGEEDRIARLLADVRGEWGQLLTLDAMVGSASTGEVRPGVTLANLSVVSPLGKKYGVPGLPGIPISRPSRVLREGPDHAAGVAGGEDVGRDRPGDHTAGADHGPVADRDAGTEDRAAAHPDVGPDSDGLSQLQPGAPRGGAEGMRGRVDLHRRTEEDAAADGDGHHIEHDAVEVEEHLRAHRDGSRSRSAAKRIL